MTDTSKRASASPPQRQEPQCKLCRFWHDPYGHGWEAACRRRAPQAAIRNDGREIATVWPTTGERDYCGDFERRPVVARPRSGEPRPDVELSAPRNAQETE